MVVASIINFEQSLRVAVLVHDVSDGSVVCRMIRDVQRVFRHIVGGWRVTVRASARGQWRLELGGASGRHVWMFAAPMASLSAIVVEKLEAFLRDAAAQWRPLSSGA
jgi:hypothetical protein